MNLPATPPEFERTKQSVLLDMSHRYISLPASCIADLELCTTLHERKKGHILVREGELADKTYYIAQGGARVYYLKDGRDITDWFAFDHEFISPIQSFFLGCPSPHYLATTADSLVLEISRADINRLSDQYRALDRLGKIVVTQSMLKLQARIISIQFETARQKYESLIKVQPDIEQRLPLMHIASYLGITLETLSRIRHPQAGI